MDYGAVNKILQAHIEQSGQWLRDALSKKRPEALEHYNRSTEKKLTRKPPTRWQLRKRKGKRLLIKVYHRLVRR